MDIIKKIYLLNKLFELIFKMCTYLSNYFILATRAAAQKGGSSRASVETNLKMGMTLQVTC